MNSPLRRFIAWILEREDIRITTVHIEYFKAGGDESDPIIFKFGHRSTLRKEGKKNDFNG